MNTPIPLAKFSIEDTVAYQGKPVVIESMRYDETQGTTLYAVAQGTQTLEVAEAELS